MIAPTIEEIEKEEVFAITIAITIATIVISVALHPLTMTIVLIATVMKMVIVMVMTLGCDVYGGDTYCDGNCDYVHDHHQHHDAYDDCRGEDSGDVDCEWRQ